MSIIGKIASIDSLFFQNEITFKTKAKRKNPIGK
jgi:hypothetical protein